MNDNDADRNGGGIFSDGNVTMNDTAHADGNTAAGQGGGIFTGFGTLTMNQGAHVNANTATVDGGGVYNNGGTLVGVVAAVNVAFNLPNDVAP